MKRYNIRFMNKSLGIVTIEARNASDAYEQAREMFSVKPEMKLQPKLEFLVESGEYAGPMTSVTNKGQTKVSASDFQAMGSDDKE